MKYDEKVIKHLEMIEGIINRMANNSALLKGWTVTIVAAIFILANKDYKSIFMLGAYVPIVVFWFLDSSYLKQERTFKALYDEVRKKLNLSPDGELKNNDASYDFDMSRDKLSDNSKLHLYSTMFSWSTLGFYLPLALICAFLMFSLLK